MNFKLKRKLEIFNFLSNHPDLHRFNCSVEKYINLWIMKVYRAKKHQIKKIVSIKYHFKQNLI